MSTRQVGRGVQLSTLAFGSMRMHERGYDLAHWEHLLTYAAERGVTTHHSSSEYESFPKYCEVLARLSSLASRVQHVVKLADPHFGEAGFDALRLRTRIDAYLSQLRASRIDVVQWMWRGDLKREDERLDGLARDMETMTAAFDALRSEGKIGTVHAFPYTAGFAEALRSAPWCDGLTIYVNPQERDMLPELQQLEALQRSAIALRPLFAGRALEHGQSPRELVQWALAQPAVASAVVSFSSEQHLDQLLD